MEQKIIDKRVLILLLSCIGLIVLPHASHIPVALFVFFCCVYLWRFLTIPFPRLLPNKIAIFITTLLATILLISQHQGVWGRDAGTALFITALGLKLLEIRKDRDLYLTTFLAFFVAATQFLYVQDIFMAVYIFIVCCLLLCTLIFINSQHAKLSNSLKTSAIIILQATPLMLLLFLFVPRLQAPNWSLLEQPQSGLSGLSDTLEPGSLTDLALSSQIAFRVTFEGKIPPNNQRYWRGPVLSHTDGRRWTPRKYKRPFYSPETPRFSGTRYKYKMLLEPQRNSWVYALDLPAQFKFPVTQNPDFQLSSKKKPSERAEYEIVSYTHYKTGGLMHKEMRANLELPAQPSQRVIDFVDSLHGFEHKPELFIQNFLNHLKNNNFRYTLKPPLYPDKPIETFFFESRLGFCSHYATAFTYFMRVAHIPARVVTGYQGGELNSVGNFLEIRQANAHAWAEVWLPNQGWKRIDPTATIAPDRVEQNINLDQQQATGEVNFTPQLNSEAMQWLQQLRSTWRNIDYTWHRWIINYNGNLQADLLSALGINNLKTWALWLLSATVIFTLLLSLLLFKQRAKADEEVIRLYKRYCQKLAKTGLVKQNQEGAEDFAKRCIAARPELTIQIRHITRLYNNIRYARNPAPDDLLSLKKSVSLLHIKKQYKAV